MPRVVIRACGRYFVVVPLVLLRRKGACAPLTNTSLLLICRGVMLFESALMLSEEESLSWMGSTRRVVGTASGQVVTVLF